MGIDASFLRLPARLSGIVIDQDFDMHDTVTPAILHTVNARYIDGSVPAPSPPPPVPPWQEPFDLVKAPGYWENVGIVPVPFPGSYESPDAWYVVGDVANFFLAHIGPFWGHAIQGLGATGKQYLIQAGYDYVNGPPPYGPFQWFDLYVGGTPQAGVFKFHIRDCRGILPEVVVDLQADPYFNAYPPATRVWIPPAYQALMESVPWICYFEVDITPTTDLNIAVFEANYP